MTITLLPEIEKRLKLEASRRGVDANTFASTIIAEHLPPANSKRRSDHDDFVLRGTFTYKKRRSKLFEKSILLTPGKLAKRKPHVNVDRRMLENLAETD